MTRALLLDLDDTLLHNSMDRFLPPYFHALTVVVGPLVAAEPFLQALREATRAMIADSDPRTTNEEVFWRAMAPRLPVDRAALEARLTRYYERDYGMLREVTEPVPGSRELVERARAAGWMVVVATNPLFPRRAIEQRIEWAGLEPDRFDLVTSYENSRSTKPHASYYAGIAETLGLPPDQCVMAGNQLSNDLVGAAAIGMRTFWVTHFPVDDAPVVPDGRGTLVELQQWLFPESEDGG